MHTVSASIADGLHLATLQIDTGRAPAAVPPSVHRMFDCDISGSMWGNLGPLGQHLKNTLATTVNPGDTVSIGVFSGRGQYTTIIEGVRIANLADLSSVHGAIDRYLKPLGLTSFKEPLQEVVRWAERMRRIDPHAAVSLVFMSDGHDNQSSPVEVLKAAAALSDIVSAGAVVEYGWYANRPLLTKMAESIGIPYIFAEDMGQFIPVLDAELRRPVDGVRKRDVALPVAPLHGLCFAIRGGAVATYSAEGRTVRVPEDVQALHFFATSAVGQSAGEARSMVEASMHGQAPGADATLVPGLYAALAVLSQRVMADDVLRVLKVLGDARLIRSFANCFGKQSYSAFQEAAAQAALQADRRWVEGYDPKLVPAEDAYTVLDLLADLMAGKNFLHLSHPAFDYQRIGRRTVSAADRLSAEEQAEIAELTARAKSATDLAKVQARMAAIIASKPEPVRFEAADREAGVPMSKMTLNESRPNVSMLTTSEGVVAIGANPVGLPERVPSRIHRNYAVIKDGILNMKMLPVSLDRDTHAKLAAEGLVDEPWVDGAVYEVRLDGLPIINRRMVRQVSAREFFDLQYELARARAAQKVFGHLRDKHFPPERSAGLKQTYGEDAANWLKSIGVTDGGFSPPVVQAEASDIYIGRELKSGIKGLSSLPKVEDVQAKMAGGKKLTVSDSLMAPFIEECQAFVDSNIYGKSANPAALLKTWIEDKTRHWVARSRELNRKLSEIKFSICVGQVWFPEFDTIGEGELAFRGPGGEALTGTATLKDIEVAI